jgi:signal transduction histidine kinase
MRRFLVRLIQVAITFALYAACNVIAVHFQVDEGVSILFPATAVSIVACMSFGWWAAIGIVLASIATPGGWGRGATFQGVFVSGIINTLEGLIPYLVFRYRRDLSRDLRDMKSLVAFIIFGTVLNSGVTAALGALFVFPEFSWHTCLVWWMSDFVAAVLLALPVLAFGGALLARMLHTHRPEQPRTIANALQIITVIILLGFGASFGIRAYLLSRFEETRIDHLRMRVNTRELLIRLQANFLRAAFADPNDLDAATKIESARRTNEELLRDLQPIMAALPNAKNEFERASTEITGWFTRPDRRRAQEAARSILALRAAVDQSSVAADERVAAKRRNIVVVTGIVDAAVFLILVLASTMLLYTISRPFAQLRNAILTMSEGQPPDTSRIDARYLEFKSIADTLGETGHELRRREEELRLQTEKAIRASQHKSDFLAKMSHELRTPLNAIIGFSDLLIEQEDTIERTKRLNFLDNVAGSAKHLLKLINDLLDIAKVESGKLKLELTDVDLRMAVKNTVATTQSLFVKKRQQVDVALPDQPMMIRADAARVEQVLLNLLSNANKFSPEGERISIRGEAAEQMWRIEVRDHGIGIRPEDHARIFDEFEQVDARGLHPTGTGLGLALAKRFVEAHGGAIAVESALGAGSVFRVTLPRLQAPFLRAHEQAVMPG